MSFPTTIKRFIVVAFENKSYSGVVASGPYFKILANTYSRPTNEMDNNNPSLPNYLAITCGSNLGKSGDSMSGFPQNIQNIYRSLTNAGLTYGNWGENYSYPGAGKDNCGSGGPCNTAPTVCHHTPGTFYSDSVSTVKVLTDFYTRYRDGTETPPNYCFISPSNCCNAHDCSIATADNWLKNTFNLPKLMTKPWYTDGSTCFVIWFDEGYGSPRYDVFVSPSSMKHDHTGSTTGYEGLSTVMWLLGLTDTLNNSNASKAMKDLFITGPIPLTVTLTNQKIITLGQPVTFTATASGGTPGYTFSWIGLPAPCVPSNQTNPNVIICTPTVGTYNITVTAKDTVNQTASANGTLTVNPPSNLTASLMISPNTITLGQTTTETVTVTGGTPPYQFSWTGFPTPCSGGNVNTVTCTPNVTGIFNIKTTVTDSAPTPASVSATGTLTVNPITPTKYSCTGAPNYQCIQDPNGQYNSLAECQIACKPPSTGKFNVYDVVLDGTTTKRGVTTILDTTGTFTKDQACVEVCNRLGKISGNGNFNIFDVSPKRGVTAMQNDSGKYTKANACIRICDKLGQL